MKTFRPHFCIGCGVDMTREPWPHLDRGLLMTAAVRVTCVECRGRGWKGDGHGGRTLCPNCDGAGTEILR